MADESPRVDLALPELEHRLFRSALEFVVALAEESQKRGTKLKSPKQLKQFFGPKRLSNRALGRVRRIVESDPGFRERIAKGAVPELVDDIGRLWLGRPSGWEAEVTRLAAEVETATEAASFETQLKGAEKRRLQAERSAVRSRVEIVELAALRDDLSTLVDDLRTDVVKLDEEREGLRAELVDARNEVRHAGDREAAAKARLDAAEHDRERASDSARRAATVRDEVLASRTDAAASVAEVESAAHSARALANQLESLLPNAEPVDIERPAERVPLSLPGGVISGSAEAAEHLARSDAAMLVDGYNVTLLQWAGRPLETQRNMLLDAVENLARRFGTDVTVVFDGKSVVGAHTSRRRFVRVVYSPEGVIADDVIRDEVRRLPTTRSVVVVTNDAEIIRDVRAEGANTVPSNAFLAVL
jgi:predicted RNA-binding protein with PIN domain